MSSYMASRYRNLRWQIWQISPRGCWLSVSYWLSCYYLLSSVPESDAVVAGSEGWNGLCLKRHFGQKSSPQKWQCLSFLTLSWSPQQLQRDHSSKTSNSSSATFSPLVNIWSLIWNITCTFSLIFIYLVLELSSPYCCENVWRWGPDKFSI